MSQCGYNAVERGRLRDETILIHQSPRVWTLVVCVCSLVCCYVPTLEDSLVGLVCVWAAARARASRACESHRASATCDERS